MNQLAPITAGALDAPAQDPKISARDIISVWLSRYAVKTREGYSRDLKLFAAFIGHDGDVEAAASKLLEMPQGQANATMDAWAQEMDDAGLASNTIVRRLYAMSSLVNRARRMGQTRVVLDMDSRPIERRVDRRWITAEEVNAMLEAADASAHPVRDRAALAALFLLGLRRAEIARLDVADIDAKGQRFAVLGKGRRERTWSRMGQKAARFLGAAAAERMAEIEALGGDAAGAPLFVSLRGPTAGRRIAEKALPSIISRLAREAGVGHVTCHAFRRGAITAVIEGADLRHGQIFARHAKQDTTLGSYDGANARAQESAAAVMDAAIR